MSHMIAINAAYWLEHTLWPIARGASGMPEDQALDSLLDQAHAPPDTRDASYPLACLRAEELPLLGATLLASELARSPRATSIARLIIALIWRDAFDLACARDLAFDTAGFGFDDYEDRHIAAIEVWQRWQATSDQARREMLNFIADSGGYAFDPDTFAEP
jgi:hypothetical protein